MQVRVSKQALHTVTSRLQTSFGEKAQAYAHISMKVDSRGLLLQVADWLLTTFNCIEGEVVASGDCHIPAALFFSVVRELPEGSVDLTCADGKTLVITSAQSEDFYFKLPCLEQSWSEPESLQGGKCLNFGAVELDYMIGQVAATVLMESTRPYATVGCFQKLDAETLRLVASDGYTLSYCDLQGSDAIADFPDQMCVSRRALLELQRACRECEADEIGLYVLRQGRVLAVSSANMQVYIRVSAVNFPGYKSALPNMQEMQSCLLVRSELQNALKRVLLATNRRRKGVQLQFCADNLLLQAGKTSSSECQESLTIAKHTTEKPATIDVNGRFINNILATIAYDKVFVYFVNDECPIVIIPETELPSCRSKHVLQPIRERT